MPENEGDAKYRGLVRVQIVKYETRFISLKYVLLAI